MAILGLGGGLDWLATARAGSAAGILVWGFGWPDYLAGSFALFWYGRGLARAPRGRRPSAARAGCFVAGVLLLLAVLQTRFLYLAEHEFVLHRAFHLVLHHLAPFLIALAWPGEALLAGMPAWLGGAVRWRLIGSRPLRAAFGVIQHPVPASVLFAGLVFLWIWPPLHLRAMADGRLFAVADWTMILDGLLFFALVLDPRPVTPNGLTIAARIVLALSVQIPQIALGGLLAFADQDLYSWYDLCGRAYAGLGAVADQQLGGLVILFGGGMMSAATALILLARLLRGEAESVALVAPGL